MPAKKYLSKINKGGNDIYIKDTEAQDAISYTDVYLGAAAASSTIIDDDYYYDVITRCRPITISNAAAGSYVWLVLPAIYSPVLAVGGVEMPMVLDSTTTIDGKSYKIWKSSNTYSGTFNVYLL